MSRKLLITNVSLIDNSGQNRSRIYQACALYEDSRMIEVQLEAADSDSILNSIYTARVKNVVANLNASTPSFSMVMISPSDTLYCFPPVAIIAYIWHLLFIITRQLW